MHLFHTVVTLIVSFLFVLICCIVTMTLFEPRMTTNSMTARQNSFGEVVFIINKIVCQFVFSFSPFTSYLPYSIMLFLLSAPLYWSYNITQQPYYDKRTIKFFRIVSTYYFWTNFMLLVANICLFFEIRNGLVIWICGFIFIGITIFFERKSNI